MKYKIITSIILLFFITNISSQSIPELKPIDEKQLFNSKYPKEKKGKWGYANDKGKFIVKPIFDVVDTYKIAKINKRDTIFLAKVQYNNKWGLLKRDGTFLIEPAYDEIKDFYQDVAIFRNNDEYGLISCYGKILIEHIQEIDQFNTFGQAWYKANDNWGVLSTDGSIILQNIYSDKLTQYLTLSLSLIKSKNKYGIISNHPITLVQEAIYDSIFVDKQIIICKKDGLLGCLAKDGTYITEPKYEEIESLSAYNLSFIQVKQNGKYGIIDKTGAEIIPPIMKTDQSKSECKKMYLYLSSTLSGSKIPYLYYNENDTYKKYSYIGFDKFILEKGGIDFYRGHNLNFPYWMRSHLYKKLDTDEAINVWKTEEKLSPIVYSNYCDIQSVSNFNFNEMKFYQEESYYVSVNKDMTISDASYNIEYLTNGHVSTVKINKNEVYISLGNILATLFKSVDTKKVKEYDSQNGSNILHDWDKILFKIPFLRYITDNHILVCIDMYVNTKWENTHMQKIIACLNLDGNILYTIKENGELYDLNNYVDEDEDEMIVNIIDKSIVFSAKYNLGRKTTIYTDGKKSLSIDDFIVVNVFSEENKLFLAGMDTNFEDENGVLYIYEKNNIKKIDIQIDLEEEFIKYSNDLLYIFDKKSKLLKRICNINQPNIIIPAIRYVTSEWDGQNIIAISRNYWYNIENVKWEYIPKAANLIETKIGNVDVSIFPVNEFGYSIYGIKYENEPIENYRFGIIGHDKKYFTMPIFEDIKWISENIVSVKNGDLWREMSIEELNCYTNQLIRITSDATNFS